MNRVLPCAFTQVVAMSALLREARRSLRLEAVMVMPRSAKPGHVPHRTVGFSDFAPYAPIGKETHRALCLRSRSSNRASSNITDEIGCSTTQ